jgi:uncharacterized protein YdaU (DUF1376 family)
MMTSAAAATAVPDHTGLPAPPVPPDCDLHDLEYMPLMITRLCGSRTWLRAGQQPELGYYLMMLWMKAWQAFPAASLEDDELVLANAAGASLETWRRVRDQLMTGWVKCSDGRLYHTVLAARALETWETRVHYRENLAKARAVKAARRRARQPQFLLQGGGAAPASTAPQAAPLPERNEVIPPPPATTEQAQKTASSSTIELKSEDVTSKSRSLRSRRPRRGACARVCDDHAFDEFLRSYPIQEAPRAARVEWDAALARGASAGDIMRGLAQHRFADNVRWIKNPANWLAAECWRSPGVDRGRAARNGWVQMIIDDEAADAAAGGNPFLAVDYAAA